MPGVNELLELLCKMKERASVIIVSADSVQAAADFLRVFDSGQEILRHQFRAGPAIEYLQDRLFGNAWPSASTSAPTGPAEAAAARSAILGTISGMLRHV